MRIKIWLACATLSTVLLTIVDSTSLPQEKDVFASEKATYYNLDVLHAVVDDISNMKEPELRSFSRYIEECVDNEIDDVAKHACVAAQESYNLEFSQILSGKYIRALDQFMAARRLLMERPASTKVRDASGLEGIVDMSVKEAKIWTAIEDAVRARYHILEGNRQVSHKLGASVN